LSDAAILRYRAQRDSQTSKSSRDLNRLVAMPADLIMPRRNSYGNGLATTMILQ
jgi:hypothetical protein